MCFMIQTIENWLLFMGNEGHPLLVLKEDNLLDF